MLKKMTVLAMAVGVVAALALPASASATWKHHNTAIGANAQIGLTGNARFQGEIGGVECQVTSKVTFLANQTTGNVESFVPHPTGDTANCKGLLGLAFCQIHDVTPLTNDAGTLVPLSTTKPWVLHTTENAITVTNGPITSQATGGFCPVKHILLSAGSVIATPNQPNTVSSVTLSNTLTAQLETSNGVKDSETVTVAGSLSVEAPNAGTYSI